METPNTLTHAEAIAFAKETFGHQLPPEDWDVIETHLADMMEFIALIPTLKRVMKLMVPEAHVDEILAHSSRLETVVHYLHTATFILDRLKNMTDDQVRQFYELIDSIRDAQPEPSTDTSHV